MTDPTTPTPLEYEAVCTPTTHSRAGIASLVMFGLCMVVFVLLTPVRPAAYVSGTAVAQPASWFVIVCIASPIAGIVLGILGIRDRTRLRITAKIGLCLNIVALLALAVLVA